MRNRIGRILIVSIFDFFLSFLTEQWKESTSRIGRDIRTNSSERMQQDIRLNWYEIFFFFLNCLEFWCQPFFPGQIHISLWTWDL